MFQIFKNWPNASIAAICAMVLSVVFLLGIATAPGNQTTVPTYLSSSSR